MLNRLIHVLQKLIFKNRLLIILSFFVLTLFFAYKASQIQLDASFNKNIPLQHPYMQTYLQYQDDFGGANSILIAVCDKSGNIYKGEFFNKLKQVHDQLFFIPGVDRSSVLSLFSPAVRYTEIVEEGFTGGPVISADFDYSEKSLQKVSRNVEKSGQIGRLVSNDGACAMVQGVLLDINPETQQPVDTIKFAQHLESDLRQSLATAEHSIHIIGFAKMVGDVAAGAKDVIYFFGLSILITSLLVYLFCRSILLTLLPVICSIVAMVWKIGILSWLGYGIDPMSVLLPFLIFAIGVSHGVQMINSTAKRVVIDGSVKNAAKQSFRRLVVPGFIALLSDCIGFITILSIDIGIIQELAIAASIGVAVIILTNLILLPVLISYLNNHQVKVVNSHTVVTQLWQKLSFLVRPDVAAAASVIMVLLFILGSWQARDMQIGDLHAGAPALHESSVYNQDTFLITDKFSIGVDILTVVAESKVDACTDYSIMKSIDNFEYQLSQVNGVQSTVSLAKVAKTITAGYNEGNPKWRVLPENTATLAQSVSRVPTSSGLLTSDCSRMTIILFLNDHKAQTIDRVISAVKRMSTDFESDNLKFKLALGPAGVMGATNEAVSEAQNPMMIYVFGAVFVLCLATFRNLKATLAVILPLYLVSVLAQALMTQLQIGLTVYTLPVIALGVGIGVDYGIYILSSLVEKLKQGEPLQQAYFDALIERGSAVVFTGFTLAVGVSTWLFSSLKFQVDMGVLLTFMFLVNMLGAVLFLPALCRLFWWKR
nr:efflux RND transporter permease subunit [Gayadomonas joobiniege]